MSTPLTGKTVAILAAPEHEDLELHYPRLRFKEAGLSVVIVGLGEDEYTGKKGLPVSVDENVDDVSASDFDAIVIPGGWSPDFMRRSESLLALVRQAHEDEKVVAAICHGPWVLVSAGIARGKTMTCFHSIEHDVRNAGAEYVDRSVVVDGRLITSRQPDDLPDFCRAILSALES